MARVTPISTCLWFNNNGHEAAEFYVSLIPNSAIEQIFQPSGSEFPVLVTFNLDGVPYQALNGGPEFQLTEACSIAVTTKDQAETDRLWEMLCAKGGKESQCGWLKDRYGLSWQIIPKRLKELLSTTDKGGSDRCMQALLKMKKIDIAKLEQAFNNK